MKFHNNVGKQEEVL